MSDTMEHQLGQEGGVHNDLEMDLPATLPATLPAPKSRLGRIIKGVSLKDLVKQYGIPMAVFYIVFCELLVVGFTYLLHYNYISQGSVLDLLGMVGLGDYITADTLHTASFELGPISISALFLTNYSFTLALSALIVPIKLPFCIWLYTKVFAKWFVAKKKIE